MASENRKNKHGFRFFTLRILLLLFVCVFIFLSIVPIDLSSQIPRIKERVEGKINASILLGKVYIKIFPLPTVTLEEVTIVGADDFLVKAEKARASIGVLPLLSGNFHVKKVTVDNAAIFLNRNSNGRMNTSALSKEPGAGKGPSTDIVIRNSKVAFTDNALTIPLTMVFSLPEMYFNKTTSGFTYSAAIGLITDDDASMNISGEVKFSDTGKEVVGTLKTSKLRINDISQYLSSETKKEMEVKGRLESNVSYTLTEKSETERSGLLKGTIAASNVTLSMPSVFKELITVDGASSTVDISWDNEKRVLELKDTILTLAGFSVKSTVKVKHPEDTVYLKLESTAIDAAQLLKNLPYGIMPTKVRSSLESLSAVKGSVAIKNVTFSNEGISTKTMTDYFKAVQANISFIGLGFKHPAFDNTFSSLGGTIQLANEKLDLQDLSGKYGKGALEKLNGTITNLSKTAEIQITARASLDTAETLHETKKLFQNKILNGANGTGVAIVDINLTGKLPHLDSNTVNSSIKGLSIKMESTIDLTNASFFHKELIEKDPGYILIAKNEISIDDQSVKISRGNLKFGMSEATVTASFSRSDPSYYVSLKSSKASIEDLLPVTPYLKVEDEPVRGEIGFNITKKFDKGAKYPSYTGTAYVKNGLFKTTVVNKTLRDVNINASFNGNSATFTITKMHFGNSDAAGELRLTNIDKRTTQFSLFSNKFVLQDFVPSGKQKKNVKTTKGSQTESRPLTGRGKITAKNGDIYGLSFSSLTTDVNLSEKSAEFTKTSFLTNGGMVEGGFSLRRKKEDPVFMDMSLTANAIELKGLIKDFGAKNEVIDGNLSLGAKLECKRSAKTFASCLNGTFWAKAKEGSMRKFILLNKVFAVVNILSITELFEEGAPYKAIKGDFSVKDGVISSDNLVYDGKSMRMSSIGRMDLPNKTIDAVLALHPFVTIDKIVSNIPLVGWIVTGKDKSMITLFYSIKGPLKSPEVKPITTEEMGKDIQETFMNILKQTSEKVVGEKAPKKTPSTDNLTQQPAIINE